MEEVMDVEDESMKGRKGKRGVNSGEKRREE